MSKELHITYLQKYKTENITPPGLKLHKKPQIKKLNDKQTRKNSLNDSSGKIIDILISQHQSDLKTIKELLETSKQGLNTCNEVSNHLNLIDNWLSNDKTTFFNFLNNEKQNKFINHFLKATRNESNSTNNNINSPIKKDNHRNQNLSNSEQKSILISQKPSVHLITQPTSKTNKKKKRRYLKGRTVKPNCVYRDSVVNVSNYQLTDDEIKVLAR